MYDPNIYIYKLLNSTYIINISGLTFFIAIREYTRATFFFGRYYKKKNAGRRRNLNYYFRIAPK